MAEEKEITLQELRSIQDEQTDEHTNYLSVLPLKNVVILPKSINPVIVGRKSSIQAVEYALKHNKSLFVTAQKNPNVENPTGADIFEYGLRATILQVIRMPNNALKILIEGICRARIIHLEEEGDFMGAYYEDLPTINDEHSIELEALWRQIKDLYTEYSRLNERAPQDLLTQARTVADIDNLVDTIAVQLSLSFDERQSVLEHYDLYSRILKIAGLLQKEIEILQTEQRIKGRIQTQVEKNQREYYLNEQMKAIQKELGRDDHSSEISKIQETLDDIGLTEEAREKVEKELKRLEQMPPLSSEAVVSRHYIDWVIGLPWKKASKDNISLAKAEKLLNGSHAGLQNAKNRILEFLAAIKFSGSQKKSPVICLVGAPGVGKTSLAKSVAESLGREFVRIALGGVRDEAEIRGHRRTYIGALPGKIVQAMKKAKVKNPVILLDEIDKMSNDVHGDPSAALLEVLDPEQNSGFIDHFLDLEYDLSQVMFITTANVLDNIPYPLFDRMEIINLAGYTESEKIAIAKNFLIPKNLKEYGLTKQQFKLGPEALEILVEEYTKESGVRQLDRVIAKLVRKTIQVILKNEKKSIIITSELIKEWLGFAKYKRTTLDPKKKDSIGLSTGLAWTEVGGDVLEIEASIVPGKGTVTLTGQLGEVMQESAQAAMSYIRTRCKELDISPSFASNKDIHIHIPEGATPKDGPSAGITMCIALVSALSKNPVKKNIAMTGEVTLRGRVLAVGGLKEKILAAKRYGIKTIFLPQENHDDVQEFIKDIDKDIELVFIDHIDQLLEKAFEKNPFKKRPMTKVKKVTTIKAKTKKKK
ncbi:endopeptidase La [candidate division TM6 bacterium RIFCSPHIGHO2_12_FULL_36_22]|nr:MAG: endopeptidase La [candidate division TM6 bacterium RIFCSPHIGHO2_12_FULL_36_22]